jgi:hypothetical protein
MRHFLHASDTLKNLLQGLLQGPKITQQISLEKWRFSAMKPRSSQRLYKSFKPSTYTKTNIEPSSAFSVRSRGSMSVAVIISRLHIAVNSIFSSLSMLRSIIVALQLRAAATRNKMLGVHLCKVLFATHATTLQQTMFLRSV